MGSCQAIYVENTVTTLSKRNSNIHQQIFFKSGNQRLQPRNMDVWCCHGDKDVGRDCSMIPLVVPRSWTGLPSVMPSRPEQDGGHFINTIGGTLETSAMLMVS
ncbi:uncharacterized protein LOC143036937 isoform X5 [Oratosquilla oratoria]|uniref:uncharacterized protein LOC143036937 isoform X5 n=1 Tax=Oratosquilla oratoria TaxID=337810 RepID=UPI003F763194